MPKSNRFYHPKIHGVDGTIRIAAEVLRYAAMTKAVTKVVKQKILRKHSSVRHFECHLIKGGLLVTVTDVSETQSLKILIEPVESASALCGLLKDEFHKHHPDAVSRPRCGSSSVAA